MGQLEKKCKQKPLPELDTEGKLIEDVWWLLVSGELKVEEDDNKDRDYLITEK